MFITTIFSIKFVLIRLSSVWVDLLKDVKKLDFTSSYSCLSAFCLGSSCVLFLRELWSAAALSVLFLISVMIFFKYSNLRPIFFAALGFCWLTLNGNWAVIEEFPSEFERVDIAVTGEVVGLPSYKASYTNLSAVNQNTKKDYRFVFKLLSVENTSINSIEGQLIQLSCYRCPMEFASGQQWRLTVRLKQPHGYASWGAFDYEKYLFRHRYIAKGYVRLKSEHVLINSGSSGPSTWRAGVRDEVYRLLPDSVGRNMVLALTIGDKSGFSNTQRAVLQDSGVSHLMAISGLHIGLVFMSVAALLRWCLWPIARIYNIYPRPHLVLLPAFTLAFVYAALAGFAVSTQRALIMLAVYLLCRLSARHLSLLNILVLAASLLLLLDPFAVLDIGFWLSCGAVMIIAFVSKGSSKESSKGDLNISLIKLQPALWLGMMPMSMMFFGKLSLLSPFINLLVVPLFCLLLIPATLIVILIGMVGFTTMATWLIAKIDWAFGLIFECLEMLVSLPAANSYTTPMMWWQWALVLAIIVLLVVKYYRPAMVLSSLLLLSVLLKPVAQLNKDEIHIVLLDVGQGLAMVIETPNSITVYDTGPRYGSGFTAADAVLLPYLRRRGVKRIDTLIISHADNDHIGGYQTVVDAFTVKRVLTSRVDKLPAAESCITGQRWQFDQTMFSIIGPDENTPSGSNNLSCVLKITHQATRVLLTGDIEKQVERYMVRTNKDVLAADIMLVPHQGSKTSSTHAFIEAVDPTAALLAAGYKNHYGHPHLSVSERYLERDIRVYSTIESGSILLKINSRGWQFIEYRQAQRRFWFDRL